MFGPVLLNILAISRLVVFVVTTPQGYYRSGDVDSNKEGTYRTFGSLGGNDGRSMGYGRYGTDTISGDTCPYDNEKTFRKKREVNDEETVKTETKKSNSKTGIFLQRLRRHEAYYRDAADRYNDNRYNNDRDRYRDDRYYDERKRDDRYRDDRYNDDRYRDDSRYRDDQLYRDRYDDRYRDDSRNRYDQLYRDRYDDRYRDDSRNRDDQLYRDRYDDRDRYNDDYGGRSVGGYGRDRCGREICNWEAELECDLSKIGGGYNGYRYNGRVRWERENDAYYPRDKYEDLRDYFGTRMRSDDDGRLTITRVRPEDKGVYRCYSVGGNEEDFMEIHFFPKFPVDANAVDSRDC